MESRVALRVGPPRALYRVLTDGDVFFLPGMLRGFLSFVEAQPENTHARDGEGSSSGSSSGGGGVYSALTSQGHEQPFSMFALSLATVRLAGLFDENIFPPYYEDFEYAVRLNILGINVTYAPRHLAMFVHGGTVVAEHWSGVKDSVAVLSEERLT